MAMTIQSLTWSFGGDFKTKDPVSQQVWHGSNLSVQKGHGAFSMQPFTVNDSVSMRGIFSTPKKNILELDVKQQTRNQNTSTNAKCFVDGLFLRH